MNTLENSIGKVIERLIGNRGIPKYQFERASEPFLSLFVEEALQALTKTNIQFVVPEFPLKKVDNAQSTNADYLFRTDQGEWLLVEMKTEISPIRQEQLEIYERIAGKDMKDLVNEVESIMPATRKRRKYDWLIEQVNLHPPVEGPVRIIYITPHKSSPIEKNIDIEWLSFKELFGDFKSTKDPELWRLVSRLIEKLMPS